MMIIKIASFKNLLLIVSILSSTLAFGRASITIPDHEIIEPAPIIQMSNCLVYPDGQYAENRLDEIKPVMPTTNSSGNKVNVVTIFSINSISAPPYYVGLYKNAFSLSAITNLTNCVSSENQLVQKSSDFINSYNNSGHQSDLENAASNLMHDIFFDRNNNLKTNLNFEVYSVLLTGLGEAARLTKSPGFMRTYLIYSQVAINLPENQILLKSKTRTTIVEYKNFALLNLWVLYLQDFTSV